jgi:hypothetical protein
MIIYKNKIVKEIFPNINIIFVNELLEIFFVRNIDTAENIRNMNNSGANKRATTKKLDNLKQTEQAGSMTPIIAIIRPRKNTARATIAEYKIIFSSVEIFFSMLISSINFLFQYLYYITKYFTVFIDKEIQGFN